MCLGGELASLLLITVNPIGFEIKLSLDMKIAYPKI
jgi:hypothetical protein